MTSVIVSAPSQWDCNFESGLCTWTQAKDDQFDWTRVQGGTGTTNTGPSSDHTTGSGYYIYIETSSPRRVNDTARIISQPINVNTTMCLNFWYHMYGTSVRTLNVYMKVGGSLSPPVWSRTGTRSNQWYSASVDVQSSTSYQIVFEGVRGTSYRGDIALDDISVSMGSCSGNHSYFSYCFFFFTMKMLSDLCLIFDKWENREVKSHTVKILQNSLEKYLILCMIFSSGITSSGLCTFEDRTYCGYVQDTRDDFQWTWKSSRTTSTGTGPTNDHTYGTTSGMYTQQMVVL